MASFLIPTVAFTLLLFLFSPKHTFVTASVVMDVDGDYVRNGGGNYYMYPYPNGYGAGPISWINKTNSCPLYVTRQAVLPEFHLTTVTMYSPILTLFIPTGSVWIKFNDKNTPCEKPLWWFGSSGRDVFAGMDQPGFRSFVIKDADNVEEKYVYEFTYCFEKFANGEPRCYPVVYKSDNSGLLEIGFDLTFVSQPFKFRFFKAQSFGNEDENENLGVWL